MTLLINNDDVHHVLTMADTMAALESRRDCEDEIVREHVRWALSQHARRGIAAALVD